MFIKFLIFFLVTQPAWSTQMAKVKSLSLAAVHSLKDETTTSIIELTARVPKKTKRFTYIPQLSIFLGHNTLDLNRVTDRAADKGTEISGSMIGLRAGVSVPVHPFGDHSFFLFSALSFAHTSVQSDPWFGQPDEATDDQSMHEFNLGIRTTINKYILGYSYSLSDIEYLKSSQRVSFGALF